MSKIYNNENISLYRWVWKSYISTILIPLCIVTLIFICTYFISIFGYSAKTANLLTDQAKDQLNSLVTQEANSINFQLSSITNSSKPLSNEMLNTITNQVLKMDIPWDGYVLLLEENGHLLAFPNSCKSDLGLSKSSKNNYDQTILENNSSDDKLNLYNNKNLSPAINDIISNETGFSKFTLNGDQRVISWSTIHDTHWKLLIVVPEKNIYFNINTLKHKLIQIGIIAITGLILSYFIFFLIISKKIKSMGIVTTNSLMEINRIVQKISNGEYTPKVPNLKIKELNNGFKTNKKQDYFCKKCKSCFFIS